MERRQIIAEVGSVHDGSFGNACKLIEAAAGCGADVVKFQTHIASAETLPNAPSPSYFKKESRFEYFERTGFSEDQWSQIIKHCEKNNIRFLSSPFSIEAIELLGRLGANSYKVPSGETTNIPLLKRLAETGKPILLSTGMSNWKEIDQAVDILINGGPLVVMQCSSAYPCPPELVGLNVIEELKERYQNNITVGFSDHTIGLAASFAAAALGAEVIEKHFTFSRLMYGSDASNSMEPEEFKIFTDGIRKIWKMKDNPVDKDDLEPYKDMKKIFQKSLVTVKDLESGTVIKREDITEKKPGTGIPAANIEDIVGKRTTNYIEANTLLKLEDIE